jgi:hypothetical protein
MLVIFALVSALQTSPAPAASTAPVPAATASPAPLPTDPEKLARQQFAAFLSGNIDQRWYSQPLPQNAIDQVHAYLQSLGAVKSFALLKTADTPYGKGYAYKVTCAHGAAIEQFTSQGGVITAIRFSLAP